MSLNETGKDRSRSPPVMISLFFFFFPFLFFSFRRQVTNSSRREQCNIRGAEIRGRSRGTMHPSGVKGDKKGREREGKGWRRRRRGPERRKESHARTRGLIVAFTSAEQPEKRIERKRGEAAAEKKMQDSQDPGWTRSYAEAGPRYSRLHATYPARNTRPCF